MRFILDSQLTTTRTLEYVLVPYFEDVDISSLVMKFNLDANSVKAILRNQIGGMEKTVVIPYHKGLQSITFLNMGPIEKFDMKYLMDLFRGFGMQAESDYQILLDGLEFGSYTLQQVTEAIIRAMYQGAYTFQKDKLHRIVGRRLFCLRDDLIEEKNVLTFTIISGELLQDSIDKAVIYGQEINYARVLGDLPNNYLKVQDFADYLEDLAKEYHLPYEILGNKELEALHSGGILGVNAGNKDEAKLITIYYEGSKDAPVTALIGKGVMFDSGGYHLKSISGMQGMKFDMCGAANIAAAFEIAVRRNSKQNLLLIIPAVENLIGPSACKMGDVLTTMSGKTVEVYNIDAEGRLILCDAITYAVRKSAEYIIDLATLTYSCQKTLGNEISGIYSNEDSFYQTFLDKTRQQCEKVWRLPLDLDYHKLLYRTQTADLINYAPDRDGGANVAACFLEEFVDNIPWIHLDIVGTAVNRGDKKHQSLGATGVLAASIAAFIE